MAEHTATIAWRAGSDGFRKGRFSRAHQWHFDGGLTIAASSSPAVIPPPWSDPAAIDPEEAFVAAIASCHMMSFLYVANQGGIEVVAYDDDASGRLTKNADGMRAITTVTLRPRVSYGDGSAPDAAGERALHDAAHAQCFIAHSVLSEIIVELPNVT